MNRLEQLLTQDWAVRGQSLDRFRELITPAIIQGRIEAARQIIGTTSIKTVALAAPYNEQADYADDTTLPDGSVVVVHMRGLLYAWDTDRLIAILRKAEQNRAVSGVILAIDGPGGHVARVDVAADIVSRYSKPIAAVVSGEMCSAHFWIGTAAQRIFLESRLCEVGSVGTMGEFSSLREFYKMQGVEQRHVYPDSSDLKNEETRAIEENNDESIAKLRLAQIHKLFAETVAANLGITYDPTAPIFRGRVFAAEEALANGYAHQYGTVEDAAKWIVTQNLQAASKLF